MKKILLSSFVLYGFLFANQLSYLPLDKKFLSEENGGDKSAVDSYSDGIGIYILGKFQIDNRAMNELVFTHGEEAKKSGETLKEFVLGNGTNVEKDLADKLGNIAENKIPEDGISCDDGNVQTINDMYLNGICKGTNVEGQTCNDNNAQTINDMYLNGICIGVNVEGQTCNDNNAQTINDKYVNGVCKGTNVEGQICDDNNSLTENDKYVNGVCIGTFITSCDDGKLSTKNDLYVNGVCIGTDISYTTNTTLTKKYPTNNTGNNTYGNFQISGNIYTSNGGNYSGFTYSNIFLNTPTSGIYRYKISVNNSTVTNIGICSKPTITTWDNNRVSGTPYSSSIGAISATNKTYYFYLDADNRKAQITELNGDPIKTFNYGSTDMLCLYVYNNIKTTLTILEAKIGN